MWEILLEILAIWINAESTAVYQVRKTFSIGIVTILCNTKLTTVSRARRICVARVRDLRGNWVRDRERERLVRGEKQRRVQNISSI
jgi:hypothetical protein